VLLVGAGLLVRTVAHLQHVPPGFDASRVLTLELTLTGQKYPNGPAVLNAYRDLWSRLDHIPGVESAGGVSSLPLSGFFAWGPITVEGRVPPPGESFINADMRTAAHHYFETMGIPLRQGRFFNEQDTADAMPVAIVDEFMANELWPGQDPLGKRIRYGDLNSTLPWQTVVGVVGRVKQYGLDTDGRIALYRPQTQQPGRSTYVTLRVTGGQPASIATAVRQQIRDLDLNLPIYRMRPMTALVEASMARQRFAMLLLGVFALLALSLAAIGTYGVMAHVVTQGTRELGIRLALGATNGQILGMVLRHGLGVAAAGLIIGLAAAAMLTRLMATLIVGVTARDPLTFGVVAAALTMAATMATLMPALRASRVDPVVSLRSE
jgi:predicted permease